MDESAHADEWRGGLFSSRRERRLWIWTVAVVVAVYSTLGLARSLADVLRNRNLLDALFAFGFLLVLASIAWLGLTKRANRLEIGVALGVVATYLLVFVRMGIPEERTHLVEYGVVSLVLLEALTERASNGRRVSKPALIAIAVTAVLGGLDEVIQAILPNRVFDPVDIFVNVAAGTLAVAASVALRWARRRVPSPRPDRSRS